MELTAEGADTKGGESHRGTEVEGKGEGEKWTRR